MTETSQERKTQGRKQMREGALFSSNTVSHTCFSSAPCCGKLGKHEDALGAAAAELPAGRPRGACPAPFLLQAAPPGAQLPQHPRGQGQPPARPGRSARSLLGREGLWGHLLLQREWIALLPKVRWHSFHVKSHSSSQLPVIFPSFLFPSVSIHRIGYHFKAIPHFRWFEIISRYSQFSVTVSFEDLFFRGSPRTCLAYFVNLPVLLTGTSAFESSPNFWLRCLIQTNNNYIKQLFWAFYNEEVLRTTKKTPYFVLVPWKRTVLLF